jgi:hypothetical protein
MRLVRCERAGQNTIILHFGDHDPSGIDMTRDIEERLSIFGAKTTVNRLALNYDQIEQYNPPPNPAKTTDSRFESYRARYGDESWELDALEPRALVTLVTDNVNRYIDQEQWERKQKEEDDDKQLLRGASDRWDDIAAMLTDGGLWGGD